jgi:hypothetical protein
VLRFIGCVMLEEGLVYFPWCDLDIGKQEWCLNFWHFDYKKALSLIKEFLANKELYRNQVNLINKNAKNMLNQIVDQKMINAIAK